MYNYTGRIDQHMGSKDFIFFRYAGIRWSQTAPSTLPTLFTSTEIPAQQYGSSSTATSQTGFGLADFLLDYPNSENKRNVLLSERPGGIGSAFVQDSWKVTRNLTANYGLRYDRSVIPAYGTEASVGLQGSIETDDFDFNTGQYIIQQLPPLWSVRGHAPCLPSPVLPPNVRVATGGKILHGSKDNIGSRLGLAYRVNDKMSVRGGFDITYDNWAAIIQMTQNY